MTAIERLRRGVFTRTAEETRAIGDALARNIPPDATLALHGDLGAGKTTLVQGLALGLGVASSVTSPTFTVYNLHRGAVPRAGGGDASREKGILLMHLDAYRLSSPEQVDALLLDDFLVSPYCLAVEWPENIADWLPADAWHLELSITGDRHSIRLR